MIQPPREASPRPISDVPIEDREADGQPGGWMNLQEDFIRDDQSPVSMWSGEGEKGGDFSTTLGTDSLPTYLGCLPSCLHSGNATGLLWLGLHESALISGIQPPADSLDPSFWPEAFSRAENRKQPSPSRSLEPAHKSL